MKLGLDNNRMVRILDGLKPGEKVLLNPPLPSAPEEDEAHTNGLRPPVKTKFIVPGKLPAGSKKVAPHADPNS